MREFPALFIAADCFGQRLFAGMCVNEHTRDVYVLWQLCFLRSSLALTRMRTFL